MNNQRRNVLRLTSVIALMASTGLITSAQATEWNKSAFEGKSLDDVLKAIGGAKPETSADIIMRAPDIAENGAVVPVGVETKLKATQIAILVEKNPNNLAAQFMLPEGAEAFVTTRVKMGQSSNVHALVKADGKWYVATKEIKVTLGGCGG
ncbi:MAG: thiosulfate oxidation carrier protein SoxY [Alcaligenaceae bacterium]|nr:MAG: thiosulfate oxidation carrier protein SoxY [Alcaligenaceae bacterium]